MQDLRYAIRTVRKNPGLAVVCVLSLTLGIGANAAIFSVVKAVLLEPLPYPHAERLAILSATDRAGRSMSLSYPDVLDWQNQTRVFAGLAGFQDYGFTLLGGDQSAARLPGRIVSANFVLAVVGIYGVMAYSASQRTGEIGIRLALGASPFNVLWLVVRQGMAPVCVGIVLGLAAVLGVARALTSVLYGVSQTDPLTLALVSSLLFVVALVACIIPAQRAASIDPMKTLYDR